MAFNISTIKAEQLLSKLIGNVSGLSNFNIKVLGDDLAVGEFGDDPFGLRSGIVLSTGDVTKIVGKNDSAGSLNTDLKGDDSTSIVISFDADEFVSELAFNYVFGSEEFLAYAGSAYNDSFSLSVNGTNYAKLSNGQDVTINNLASTPDGPFNSDYINNPVDSGQTQLNGYTKPLTFKAPIKAGRNELVINVKDVSDEALDSAVFIKGGSIRVAAPDLQVTGLNVNGATIVNPGQNISLNYTVKNVGDIELKNASWTDGVYISKDYIFSDDDVLISSVSPNTGTVAKDGSYTREINATLPTNFNEDNYFVFVVADNGNKIREIDEENNISGAKSLLAGVEVPEKIISVKATKSIAGETKTGTNPREGKFTLKRTGDLTAPLDVNYTIEGTATGGTDYQALPNTATFDAGKSETEIDVKPIDDLDAEGRETVILKLSNGEGYGVNTPKGTATIDLNDNDDKMKIADADRKLLRMDTNSGLKFKLAQNLSKDVYQFGFYTVDDTTGKIDGVAPGEAGYQEKVFSKGQPRIIFDALDTIAPGFDPSKLERTFDKLPADTKIGFFVRDKEGKINFGSDPVTTGLEPLSLFDGDDNTLKLKWRSNDGKSLNLDLTIEKNDYAPNMGNANQGRLNEKGNLDGVSLDLTGMVAPVTQVDFEIYREADYTDVVGFYRAEDASGALKTETGAILQPSDAGYTEAALNAAINQGIQLSAADKGSFNAKSDLSRGIYLPIVVTGGSLNDALAEQRLDLVYTAFAAANPDKQSHFVLLGDNCFGFEDMANGGDQDYNDIVVKMSLAEQA
jgi:hypothetical protein